MELWETGGCSGAFLGSAAGFLGESGRGLRSHLHQPGFGGGEFSSSRRLPRPRRLFRALLRSFHFWRGKFSEQNVD